MEEATPQVQFIPYATEAEAQAKVEVINQKYQEAWAERSTFNYDHPKLREGQWYLSIIQGFEGEFSSEELARGVAELPPLPPDPEPED